MALIIRRLVLIVFVTFAIVSLSYGMVSMAGGSAITSERGISDATMSAEEQRKYKEEHNYTTYISNLIKGDLGKNSHNQRINDILGPAIPVSFTLGFITIVVSVLVGISAGMIGAYYQNTWPDRLSMFLALVGLSIPAFALGPMLQMLFGMKLNWLPVAQYWQPFAEYQSGSILHVILPVITLASIPAATIARLTRSSMLEALSQDYVRTALSKGVSKFNVIVKHGLKNACLPVLSYLGPAAASILMGGIVVEKIFRIPGLGTLFIDGAIDRQIELVLGVVILYSIILLLFNMIVDFAYQLIDPRIKGQM